jgi:hypothetical protein
MDDLSSEPITVLDHIDRISVNGDVFAEPANEYYLLVCLHAGMEFLYRQAKQCDDAVLQRLNLKPGVKVVGIGLPEFDSVPMPLLVSSFLWYAISAFQYALTVGAIAFHNDGSRPKPIDYVKRVMPEILAFRNKVAAHPAWTMNHSKDNDAERFASILPFPTLMHDSFHMSAMKVGITKGGEFSNSEELKPWSICKTHEQLKRRYWPG